MATRIAAAAQPGSPLLVRGQVVEPDGKTPAAGLVVHSYHRDRAGFDFGPNDNSVPTWRLQGWARTDLEGRFEFLTIGPAPDHRGRDAAHIHFTLDSKRFGRQWAPVFYLADDPIVSRQERSRAQAAGEFGWVRDVRSTDGVQQIDVEIRLKKKGDFQGPAMPAAATALQADGAVWRIDAPRGFRGGCRVLARSSASHDRP